MKGDKIVAVSLFDETGNMLRPWAEAGAECHAFDIINIHGKLKEYDEGSLTWHKGDLRNPKLIEYIESLDPDILFSFAPCTDLAVSGAKHFAGKRKINPRIQEQAMELFMIAPQMAERLGIPYMCENPRSMVSTLWRQPDFTFHPFQYGGHLDEFDTHPRWPKYIAARDAYMKETAIWCGNGFIRPPMMPVWFEAGGSKQWLLLGGKSAKTKRIRSETPRGFSIAVYQSNWSRVKRLANARLSA